MNNWTTEIPTEPGDYLFYGHPVCKYGDEYFRPKFEIMHCYKAANGMVYIVGGQFFYQSEGFGVFSKFSAEVPDLEKLLKDQK